MALPSGVLVNDFLKGPLKDWGIDVSYEAPTVTIANSTGKRTITYATAVTIRAVFKERKRRDNLTRDGLIELGDAFIMAKTTDGILQWGRITHGSKLYIIQEVHVRPDHDNPMFHFAECYLRDDA